ncbi:MAG: hypothetical protein HY520_01940 [Candidatus Aenigmarchaeota archaeon]|nr:hypothetical protein [Candidatus Aenigmarchaeota archaeon]
MKALYAGLFVFLLAVPAVQGATIQGTVFNWETLEPLPNAVVSIDTTPRQSMVAKDGAYSFSAPEGTYTIRAQYFVNAVLASETNETITVPPEGEFVLDILVLPVQDEGPPSEGLDPVDIDLNGNGQRNDLFIIVLLAAFVVILFYRVAKMGRKPKAEKAPEAAQPQEPAAPPLPAERPRQPDAELETLLAFIRKEKRLTQKDLRKAFPFSEAKMSLLLAELEHDGKIKKIKQGRGNIIVAQ